MDRSTCARRRYQRLFLVVGPALLLVGMLGCGGGSGGFLRLGPGPNNGMLAGQYAFAFSGENSNGSLVVAAGSFAADGNGHINNGMEDVTINGVGAQSITFSGTYAIGSDGRGTALLTMSSGGGNTWQFTMINSSHALLIRFDLGTVTASGTIDLQDTTAFSTARLQGNYVFGLSGSGNGAVVMAGQWTMDGAGNLSNGIADINDAISGVTQSAALSGTYAVSSNGRGTATITTSYATQNLVFYVVNAADLKFLETDAAPTISGEALKASSPYTLATLNGGLAFTVAGADHGGSQLPISMGGVLTADGNGNFTTGVLDINDAGSVASGGAAVGTYAFSTTGRGTANIPGTALGNLQFALYPAHDGTIEMVEIDVNETMSGMAKAQTGSLGTSAITGSFASNFTGVLNPATFGAATEEDITGQVNADGAGNLSGTLDINTLSGRTQGATLAASPYSIGSDGRGTAMINTSGASFNMQTYQIDTQTVLFLDLDNFRVLVGVMQKQQ